MNTSAQKIFFSGVAAIWLLTAFLSGCAHQDPMNDYEKLLETQMERDTAIARTETVSPEKLPKMTDVDHERSGDAHFQQGKLGRAYVQYTKALNLNPKNTRVRYKIGLLFLAKGLNEEATEEFQAVLEKEPDHALAHEGMGLALFQSGQPEAAEKRLRQALELDSSLWKAHTFLGIIYNQQNLPETAVREHQAAIMLEPDKRILYNNLGISFALMGEYDSALTAFKKALRTANAKTKVYNNLGLVLCRLGRYEEALEAFRRAGTEAQALNNLGFVYLEQGDHDKAIRSFERAMDVAPTFYTTASENLRKARDDFFAEPSFDTDFQDEPGASLSTEETGKGRELTESHKYGGREKRRPRTRRVSPQSRRLKQTPKQLDVQKTTNSRVGPPGTDIEKEPIDENAPSTEALDVTSDMSDLEMQKATTTPTTASEKSETEADSVVSTLEAERPARDSIEKGEVAETKDGEAFKADSASTGRYTVHIATFRERARANQYLDGLRRQGLDSLQMGNLPS